MSQLTIYSDTDPATPLVESNDFDVITDELDKAGIQIERWNADHELADDADNDTIIAAYQNEIDRLVTIGGYQTWDVRGHGLFVIHANDKVYSVLCEKDDLISVPANTKHWFDMGPNPTFTAIRLFNNPEGWVANFTGNSIADDFPLLDN